MSIPLEWAARFTLPNINYPNTTHYAMLPLFRFIRRRLHLVPCLQRGFQNKNYKSPQKENHISSWLTFLVQGIRGVSTYQSNLFILSKENTVSGDSTPVIHRSNNGTSTENFSRQNCICRPKAKRRESNVLPCRDHTSHHSIRNIVNHVLFCNHTQFQYHKIM